MKKEKSAGGVVYKYDCNRKEPLILLCYQKKLSGIKAYCLPKGHIEEGESKERAALREVYEETGVKAEIVSQINDINYTFTAKGDRINKTVTFFLMKALTESFFPNEETEDIKWCNEEEALALENYPSEKEIIKQAFNLIRMLPEVKKDCCSGQV